MSLRTLRSHFSKTFDRPQAPAHFAAHSHHPWPDVSFDAHKQAWLDAASHLDLKWDEVVAPQETLAKAHVARLLNLSSPETVVFGQNTHEFVVRLLSCFDTGRPVRVLTTDSEFHSFRRQVRRYEEAGLVEVTEVSTSPFASFSDRFLDAAKETYDLIFVSHVFFDSGLVFDQVWTLADTVTSSETLIVIDGYHSFMAFPVDLSAVQHRCFFLAGGYKYAMAGEGVCFMHCPPDYGKRPTNTGWYAAFGQLQDGIQGDIPFAQDAQRFKGSTYDPTGLYRFNAVQDWLLSTGESPLSLFERSQEVKSLFCAELDGAKQRHLSDQDLLDLPESQFSARFLTFEFDQARDLQATLERQKVITDCRGNRLRLGFSIYQSEDDVGRLISYL